MVTLSGKGKLRHRPDMCSVQHHPDSKCRARFEASNLVLSCALDDYSLMLFVATWLLPVLGSQHLNSFARRHLKSQDLLK